MYKIHSEKHKSHQLFNQRITIMEITSDTQLKATFDDEPLTYSSGICLKNII